MTASRRRGVANPLEGRCVPFTCFKRPRRAIADEANKAINPAELTKHTSNDLPNYKLCRVPPLPFVTGQSAAESFHKLLPVPALISLAIHLTLAQCLEATCVQIQS